MGRGKKGVKVVKQSLGIDEEELSNLFAQLAGDPTKLDPEIVKDKYIRLKNDIERCGKILKKFKEVILDRLETKKGNDPFFDREVKELLRFVELSNDVIKEEPSSPEQMIHIYKSLKESYIVEQYLLLCKVLMKNSEFIKDKNNLNDSFIKSFPGTEFCIFPFAKINFKFLFSHLLEENTDGIRELEDAKTYILLSLNMLYITTYDIYQLISSPDIDIDKLSEVVIMAITSAKKQIPRCDKAFKVISNSFDMLKTNMNDYYKAFVASSNPTIILENFIMDLSKAPAISTDVIIQFKKIAMFFRKKSESRPKDPKLESIFSTLDKIMKIMDDGEDTKEEALDYESKLVMKDLKDKIDGKEKSESKTSTPKLDEESEDLLKQMEDMTSQLEEKAEISN